jgi:hypothetical protein
MRPRVLILAAGEGKRWNNFRNSSKHQIVIDESSLLKRQVTQFSQFTDYIVIVSNDSLDKVEGTEHYTPKSESIWLDMAKFYSSKDAWSQGRTLLVFGDTYFTDEAVKTIMSNSDEIVFFLRKGESSITGKQYKEIFAIAFDSGKAAKIQRWIEEIIAGGYAKSAGGWFLYERLLQEQNLELSEGLEQNISCVSIDDWTEDFDYPIDLLVWEKKRQGIGEKLEILEQIVSEVPRYWTAQHMLQYEYYKRGRWSETLQRGSRALTIPCDWNIERAASCMWSAEAAYELGYTDWALLWAERGVRSAPIFFEPKGLLAHIAFKMEDWQTCYKYAIQILTHTRADSNLTRDHYWDWLMFDLIAISTHHLGKKEEALHFGKLALDGKPSDSRLQQNLRFYEGAQ